jgi:hypothetical protein
MQSLPRRLFLVVSGFFKGLPESFLESLFPHQVPFSKTPLNDKATL